MERRVVFAAACCAVALSTGVRGQPVSTLNQTVKVVVDDFRANRANGGYDIKSAFTRDLSYGDTCCIKAASPSRTMCVAAVAEIIVATLDKQGDKSAFAKLPISSWTKGTLNSARANIFRYAGTGSRGTGHALERLGLGKEKYFSDLKPYDFINFNRTNGSGHAAVFLGYLQADSTVSNSYSKDVVGFAYFSAQGKGKQDAGFADRYAYFDGHCPQRQGTVPRDCGVLWSDKNLALLSGGELWTANRWSVDEGLRRISASVRSVLERRYPGAPRAFIDTQLDTELGRELVPASDKYTGETTD